MSVCRAIARCIWCPACVCAVLSLAGRVPGGMGRLCAGDKGDSSVFEHGVFVRAAFCASEACVYLCVVLCKHADVHVNKRGSVRRSLCHTCVIGVGEHKGFSGDGRPAGSDLSLQVVYRAYIII